MSTEKTGNRPQSHQHPTVTEHPEQKRQEETGREGPADAANVGRPPSQGGSDPQNTDQAA